jgi:bleomycin hydrolase
VTEAKNKTLEEVYRILCIFFGTPPSTFDWRFKAKAKKKKNKKSKDKDAKEDGSGAETTAEGADDEDDDASSVKEFLNLTPLQFVKEIVPRSVTHHVSIINDPRNPYGKMYTVDRLGNVVGGRPVAYLNLSIESLKLYAAKTIKAGEVTKSLL